MPHLTSMKIRIPTIDGILVVVIGLMALTSYPRRCQAQATCQEYTCPASTLWTYRPINLTLTLLSDINCCQACYDTNNGSVDKDNHTCDDYEQYPNWCENKTSFQFNDADFNKTQMCCICGGGEFVTCTDYPCPFGYNVIDLNSTNISQDSCCQATCEAYNNCPAGYYIVNNASVFFSEANCCEAWDCHTGNETGCVSCVNQSYRTNNATCASCNDGYYLANGACHAWGCTTGSGVACASCVPQANRTSDTNCASCNGHPYFLLRIGDPYYLVLDLPTCQAPCYNADKVGMVDSRSRSSRSFGCVDYEDAGNAFCYGPFDDTDFTAASLCCACGGGGGPQCAAGYWTKTGVCTPCAPGRFSSDGAKTECEDCTIGRYSNAAAATCNNCSAGTWSDAVAASSCIDCSEGRWSGDIGQTSNRTCLVCGSGKYSAIEGRSDKCTSCEYGKWSEGLTATNCKNCSIGRYNDQLGATSVMACKTCVSGRFGAFLAAAECVPCSRGTFSTVFGSTVACNQCSAGRYQTEEAATLCMTCPSGTYSTTVGATARANCLDCHRGTYTSSSASTACLDCVQEEYSLSTGTASCLDCPAFAGQAPSTRSFGCCPADSRDWPVSSSLTLSIPPGKYWTDVLRMDHICETGLPIDAKEKANASYIAVATRYQDDIHSCVDAICSDEHCDGVELRLLPADNQLTHGKSVTLAAFVRSHDPLSQNPIPTQCALTVEVGIVGSGCREGSLILFVAGVVIVVTLAICCGLALEHCSRVNFNYCVETSLKVTPTDGSRSLPACPTFADLKVDVEYALSKNAPPPPQGSTRHRRPDWQLQKLECWTIESNSGPFAVQVDIKAVCKGPLPQLKQMQEKMMSFFEDARWVTGPGWKSKDLQVEVQHPVAAREVAELGADLMETAGLAIASCLRCRKNKSSPSLTRLDFHAKIARIVLENLTTPWAAQVIAGQAIINVFMVIFLPTLAFQTMTCESGFPWYIHFIWVLYLVVSSALTNWLLLHASLKDSFRDEAFQVRMILNYFRMLVGIMDWYTSATFPVISGRCGFAQSWVALYHCILGIGVMQVLVPLVQLCKLYRRYRKEKDPDERDHIHTEAIFMALRASENHVVLHAVKPAVAEKFGGHSSRILNSIEARIAFLRFMFQDVELSALQASFLTYFVSEQATVFDRIWVGLSGGISLLLSFTRIVKKMPAVRDWIWFQFLIKFPLSYRSANARIVWLLLLIIIYRLTSVLPWLGSCPKRDNDDSVAKRLSFSVPDHTKNEALLGWFIPVIAACFIVALLYCTWRKEIQPTLKCCQNAIKDVREVDQILDLLKAREFQRGGLQKKAQMISDVTEPLCLLHWKVLKDAEELPKFRSRRGAEDIPTIMQRHSSEREIMVMYVSHIWTQPDHPDSDSNDKAKNLVRFAEWFQSCVDSYNLSYEIYFWIDYCCTDTDLTSGIQALPLYIAASTHILTWRTPDFEHHSLPMLERLLAYTFCHGGLTPFAVNDFSFGFKNATAPLKADLFDDMDNQGGFVRGSVDMAFVRGSVDIDEGMLQASNGFSKSSPNLRQKLRIKMRHVKLLDPRDQRVCNSAFSGQSLFIEQLVDLAMGMQRELFTDRQPVEFGLTEVAEKLLGHFSRLEPGGDPSDGMIKRSESEHLLALRFLKFEPAKWLQVEDSLDEVEKEEITASQSSTQITAPIGTQGLVSASYSNLDLPAIVTLSDSDLDHPAMFVRNSEPDVCRPAMLVRGSGSDFDLPAMMVNASNDDLGRLAMDSSSTWAPPSTLNAEP